MKKTFLIFAAVAIMGGCATTKVPQPIGGSRADGIVKFAYEYGALEKPQVVLEQVMSEAKKRCQAWGYSDAEPFGGTGFKECVAANAYGNCVRFRNILNYQCVGKKSN